MLNGSATAKAAVPRTVDAKLRGLTSKTSATIFPAFTLSSWAGLWAKATEPEAVTKRLTAIRNAINRFIDLDMGISFRVLLRQSMKGCESAETA